MRNLVEHFQRQISALFGHKKEQLKRPLRHLVAAAFCVLVVIWIMYVFTARTLESLNVGTALSNKPRWDVEDANSS